MSPAAVPAPGTPEWKVAGLLDSAGMIGLQVAAWNEFQYPSTVPAAGHRKPQAVNAGNAAIDEIDRMIRELHALRVQLLDEVRADQDARAKRVDQLVRRQATHGGGKPAAGGGRI